MNGGLQNRYTCNGWRKTSNRLVKEVEKAVLEKAHESDSVTHIPLLIQDCHHHMRNVWIGAVTKRLSSYLDKYLAADLAATDHNCSV